MIIPTLGKRRRKKKSSPFPQVPVDQKIVRAVVRSEKNLALITNLRERIRNGLFRIPTRCLRKFCSSLPKTVVVKTNKNIGQPLIEGFRRIFASGLLRRRSWLRELYYSPSNVPLLLLRYLARWAYPWERYSVHGSANRLHGQVGIGVLGPGPPTPLTSEAGLSCSIPTR